jgi:hypothetical protein
MMVAQLDSRDWQHRKVRDWLLLLLRFAVTREQSDQSAVFAMADELDALGMRWPPVTSRFFLRTSSEVCQAITAVGDRRSNAVLQSHIARIDDPRLRRAFQAAVDLAPTTEPQAKYEGSKAGNFSEDLPIK